MYEREGKPAISIRKRAQNTGSVNHLIYSKYSEFTVIEREANFATRHVKGVPFVERRNTSSV